MLKRLAWLFVAGFVTVAGGALAIIATSFYFEDQQSRRRETTKPNPLNYQAPKPGEVEVTELALIEITNSGGVRGKITNHTKRKILSFNANLTFTRSNIPLYKCEGQVVMVEVLPGATAPFQLLCEKVDRRALTNDVEPKLSIVWVYPSRDGET